MPEELGKFLNSYQKMKGAFLKNTNALLWFLGRHAFLAILFSCLLSLAFGGFLLFEHASLLQKESETINSPVQFREDLYQAVLKARQRRLDASLNLSPQTYSDPFQ